MLYFTDLTSSDYDFQNLKKNHVREKRFSTDDEKSATKYKIDKNSQAQIFLNAPRIIADSVVSLSCV